MKRFLVLITVLLTAAFMIAASLPVYAEPEATSVRRSPSNYQVPEGHDITFMTEAKGSDLMFEWFIRYQGKDFPVFATPETIGSPVYDCFTSAELTPAENISYLKLSEVKKALDGSQIYCIVRGANGIAITALSYINVESGGNICDPNEISLHNLIFPQGELCKYAMKIVEDEGAEYHYTWYTTNVNDITTIKVDEDTYDSTVFVMDTGTAGTVFVTCMVEKTAGGKTNRSLTGLTRFVIEEQDSDPTYTMSVEVMNMPARTEYTVGDNIDAEGLKLRAWTGQGYLDVTGSDKIQIFPNNIYSIEQKSLAAVYDCCAVAVPVNVSAGESAETGKFSIAPVSQPEYIAEKAGEPFSLEVEAVNANQEVNYKWFESDKDGSVGKQVGSGKTLWLNSGLTEDDGGVMYYLCVGECDGALSTQLFKVQLRTSGDPSNGSGSQSGTPSGKGISKGAIIGIAGGIAGVLLIAAIIIIASKGRKA
ncbi:MAG: hypothetical protein J5950_02545 [Clostridia bacterium]|nr:hypothetical protein [Clostridia bacterium]